MARIPDRFDLWVRKARESADPARQLDYVLGALVGLPEWHFLNIGTKENPQPAETELEGAPHLLVFSDLGRIEEIVGGGRPLSVISLPTPAAMPWCLERNAGLLINPGDFAALIPVDQLKSFYDEWSERGGRKPIGFWIPSMTDEEEDFWQENGL